MAEESSSSSTQHVILIVDEDPNIINALTLQLEDRDWVVHTAFNSDEAMAICGSSQVEIALVGIEAANYDGMQLVEKLRISNPELITLIMTGYSMVARAVKILYQTASDYLVKPFRIEQLLMAIARAQREQGLLMENEALKQRLADLQENIPLHSEDVDEPRLESEQAGEEIPIRSTEYGGYPAQSQGAGPDAIASYERQMTPTSLGMTGGEEIVEEPSILEENGENKDENEQST